MTVQELMKHLQHYDKNATVWIFDSESGPYELELNRVRQDSWDEENVLLLG